MDVTESDAREQIQRVIHSDLLRFSELQRRLLLYLADKSLSGEADQLKEYTIAVDGLGRPESYDPRHDSTVRLQSSRLRQKIVEYYRTIGQSDPVMVDFPKGHFKLVFSRRETSGFEIPPRNSWRLLLVLWGVLTIALAGLCLYLGLTLVRQSAVTAETWTPALEQFWSPFLNRKDLTLVCVGAPLFIHLERMEFLRNSEVNSWEEAARSGLLDRLKRWFPGDEPQPWHHFTGVGEAGGAFAIGSLLAPRGVRLYFADSDQLTWNEIGEHNVIFVGPPKFIPQIADLPVVPDFVIEGSGIRNLRPRRGEAAFLSDEFSDPRHENGRTHALISRLPGLHGKGTILVLGGTWTGGTLSACQYVTLETHVHELLKRIQGPRGQLPPYFQVVLSTAVKGPTPVEVSYLLHHVLTATELESGASSATTVAH
ncbi:MAG TPA: hypothetical protein VFP96_10250 [Candidatus Acidoferrum sp.]|nr:hypothetical protein [Candidatus Acidoferrum sp.]